ncbi:UNVERIFIED_CONTAM: hypothetical protein Sradi_1319700 [Sesamum radiatum]|uniref:Uncharacterized protein n=1 Tax=Sesamum radiatum TaxID=300843 RepID=A0AAW2UQK2_SESRA
MDSPQRMVFDATGPRYFASPHKGVLDNGTRSCPMDVGPSSYCYGGGPYDYDKSGLANYFSNVVHAADHPLWDGCTQSQSSVVAKLVDIKADGHIYERIYDRTSQWANRIFLSDHTLPGDYYSTKKLVKDLGGFTSSEDSCMYMPITPRLQRLYSSRATVEHVTWHATHQTEKGSKCHPSDTEAWKHFNRMYTDFIEEPHNIRLDLCIDSFAPHDQYDRTYSCWPVIITLYNFPLGDQILDRISNISPTDEMPLSLSDGFGSDHKWMKKSIFLDLPY